MRRKLHKAPAIRKKRKPAKKVVKSTLRGSVQKFLKEFRAQELLTSSRRKVLVFLLIMGLVGFAVYVLKENKSPELTAEAEIQALLIEIGRLIVLPEGEQPIVATVFDLERLSGQPFFEEAKKGDRVLIYTNAKKAILYDPVAKRIVAIAPINLNQAEEPSE